MKEEIINGERVVTTADGRRIRPDRFVYTDNDKLVVSDDINPDDILGDDLRASFSPDLLASAGIAPKP